MFLFTRQYSFAYAVCATVVAFIMSVGGFMMLEPAVGHAIADTFIVTQSITSEISFLTTATDVSMSPSIAGLTGGTANGRTHVVVSTNNPTGYNMTIAFSSSTAMGKNGGGGYISNYSNSSSTVPDYSFSTEAYGQFAYAVQASTTTDVDQTFKSNGTSACNTGSTNTAGNCWMRPSTTAETIINRGTGTPASGATTSIQFRVHVPANPSPAIPTGTYTATATLTAVTN